MRTRHAQRRHVHARHSDHGWISWADIVTCCLGAICVTTATAAQDRANDLARALGEVRVVSGAPSASAAPPSAAGIITIGPDGTLAVNDKPLASGDGQWERFC